MSALQDPNPPRRRHGAEFSGVLGGLLIVTLGIVFLLDNLNIIESGSILRWWPALLIVFGLRNLAEARDSGAAFVGVLLTSVGAVFLLDNLNVISFSFWQLWPLLLVAFGFKMFFRAWSAPPPTPSPGEVESAQSFASAAFLGGVKRRNDSHAFRGGSATVFMGGIELDLRGAEIEGDAAVINVSVLMGGVEIRIPESWSVESKIVPLLGGVDDKAATPQTPTKRLILNGFAMMGGVEIKN